MPRPEQLPSARAVRSPVASVPGWSTRRWTAPPSRPGPVAVVSVTIRVSLRARDDVEFPNGIGRKPSGLKPPPLHPSGFAGGHEPTHSDRRAAPGRDQTIAAGRDQVRGKQTC